MFFDMCQRSPIKVPVQFLLRFLFPVSVLYSVQMWPQTDNLSGPHSFKVSNKCVRLSVCWLMAQMSLEDFLFFFSFLFPVTRKSCLSVMTRSSGSVYSLAAEENGFEAGQEKVSNRLNASYKQLKGKRHILMLTLYIDSLFGLWCYKYLTPDFPFKIWYQLFPRIHLFYFW